ncbi:MAG: phosphopantetheine-binding protein [Gammaproteobacteria bacterium]|nr:phosphopantetheine-binding protein [Gammaproteobacteria bacterium]
MAQSELERELAALIVDTLDLEDTDPSAIDPEAPLFREGLGLDSIDALELSLAIAKTYQVQLKADDEHDRTAFSTLRTLAAYVQGRRVEVS